MHETADPQGPPGWGRLALEMRAPFEFAASFAAAPWLATAPRGDGHPVIVYPGFMGSDSSTAPLRRLLRFLGHDVQGWGQGRNLGPLPEVLDQAQVRIRALAAEKGQKLSLVGWSLGGIYARELAKLAPECVRQVVSLGSPFVVPAEGPGGATHARRLYEFVNRRREPLVPVPDALRQPPPVPTTSIYSRSDGIVAWQSSLQAAGPMSESIEVVASHLGLGVNPMALYALADRLAQADGRWQPFERRGWRRLWFPRRRAAAST